MASVTPDISYFNSCMVRLKVGVSLEEVFEGYLFQFLYGAIEGVHKHEYVIPEIDFNSCMVRLKEVTTK